VVVVNLVRSFKKKRGGKVITQDLGTNLEKKRIKDTLVLHAEKVFTPTYRAPETTG